MTKASYVIVSSNVTSTVGSGTIVGNVTSNTQTGASGARYGIYITGANDLVSNFGTILGQDGVLVGYGAGSSGNGVTISNQAGGAIRGAASYSNNTGPLGGFFTTDGIYIAANSVVVTNAGSITGYSAILDNGSGATISNQSGGYMSGSHEAIIVATGAIKIVNAGRMVHSYAGYSGLYLAAASYVLNSGTITSAATLYGAIWLNSGGTIINASGGVISDTAAHFAVYASSGATTVTNAGTIEGGVSLASNTSNRLIVDPGAVFTGTVTGGGGALELGTIAGVTSVTTLAGFGSSVINFDTLTFDTNAKWSVGGSASALAAETIDGLSHGDTIDITGFTASAPGTLGAGTTLTIAGSGSTNSLKLKFGASVDGFVVTTGAFGTDITTLCFCAGTRIDTAEGEIPVENLAVGDTVRTLGNNGTRTITWIGIGKVLATRGRRSAATPVIVRKHALGPDVPHQDLHVTKAHGLYIDNVLIPVEFLVNHKTILWDDHAQEVSLYHIELDAHDVIFANGAPAESYRDDGNRWLFQNASSGWDLPPQDPCAPVLTGGPIVDAVWQRLLDHAGPRHLPPTTQDPDLHLVADGRRIDPTRMIHNAAIFTVREKPEQVRIVSRDTVPAELGLARDPRPLGVAIGRIAVRQGTKFIIIAADDPCLSDGFHDYEPNGALRWTNGDATIPAKALAPFTGNLEIVLTLAGTTTYRDDGEAITQAA